MEIIRHINDLPKSMAGAVAALGNFDGFHRGHQVVVGEAGRLAKKAGVPLMVGMTEPHPRSFFNPKGEPFRLTPFRERLALLENFGVDIAVVLPFTKDLASLTPEQFTGDVLKKGLHVSGVVVGYDYRFGKGRAGDAGVLKDLGKKFNFNVTEIPQVHFGVEGAAGEPYSSTLVRAALKEGKARKAAALLGHWWTVNGPIIDGEKRGRRIGFPTANIEFHDSIVPRLGVYAVRAWVEGAGDQLFDGVANIGVRPTFGESKVLLEAHLFDFGGDHYGRHIRLHFIGGIRPEQKFDNVDQLVRQIEHDIEAAHDLLADPENAHQLHQPPTLEEYLKTHPNPPY
ncbi:MAG: bifunctional riboflavin kinase/FAD synthetase [Proteobacteria bacterium]|nr:bifunctional riboflavin kinase/FAD synthetase [Pseudomonadota bacterium]